MAQLDLAGTMDAIAQTLKDAGFDRAYAWPVGSVAPPCVVVGYPEGDIEFDLTFGDNQDKCILPVWFIVGQAADKEARDALSVIINGAQSIKETLDGDLGGAISSGRVTGASVEQVIIGDVVYLAAKFSLEVLS